MEYLKYIMVLLGLLAGIPLVWRRREALGLESPGQALLLCFGFSLCSVLAAMAFAALEGLISGTGAGFGSISTYGVYLFCPAAVLLAARAAGKDGGRWLDMFALYALPSLFLMRVNCLLSGCCVGRYITADGPRWPVRQAEMAFYGVFLIVLLRREKAGAPEGTAFPLLAAVYGAFRFAAEWFREGSGGSLIHLAHVWSMMAVIIGLGVYFELNSGRTQKSGPRRERSVSKC